MQFILTEEEFEIYRRCMNTVKNDYSHLKKSKSENPNVEDRRKILEYSLGIIKDIPKKYK